jgi:hypothetical protein
LFEIATHLALALGLTAFVAGFVDSIAGGGGLLAVPALLLAGVPPVQTLATNKLQGMVGAGSAFANYAHAGQVHPTREWRAAAMSLGAGAVGALLAASVPGDLLKLLMPPVLLGIAAFFALRPGLDDQPRLERVTPLVFAGLIVPLIAAYDGFFGPGTGSFFMLAYVLLAGRGVLAATAQTKMLNFASNIGSFAVFAASGHVLWKVGLLMALGQLAGATLGARLAVRVGARLIRPLLVVTSTGMALRLIWQDWL